jgi:hypothetical protein
MAMTTAAEYRKAAANGTLHMLARDVLTGKREPMKPKRAQPEREIQRAIAKYLDSLPGCGEDFRWFHVPNERRNKIEAMRLAGEGVKAGVMDIWVLFGDASRHVIELGFAPLITIEVKASGGSLSKAQRDWRDWCKRAGIEWHLVRSVDEVRAIMEGR